MGGLEVGDRDRGRGRRGGRRRRAKRRASGEDEGSRGGVPADITLQSACDRPLARGRQGWSGASTVRAADLAVRALNGGTRYHARPARGSGGGMAFASMVRDPGCRSDYDISLLLKGATLGHKSGAPERPIPARPSPSSPSSRDAVTSPSRGVRRRRTPCPAGAWCRSGQCVANAPPVAVIEAPAAPGTNRPLLLRGGASRDDDPGDSVSAWSWRASPPPGTTGCEPLPGQGAGSRLHGGVPLRRRSRDLPHRRRHPWGSRAPPRTRPAEGGAHRRPAAPRRGTRRRRRAPLRRHAARLHALGRLLGRGPAHGGGRRCRPA